ncbi:MAG: capsule assembly Wzi family protein [candidate division WOR-3 bacterium]|nr:capsule assembly Wzi family protein [candidate division WOR-3 bacterium]
MIALSIFLIIYPIDSWQNEILEELQVRGCIHTKFQGVKPYSFIYDSIAKWSCTDHNAKLLYNRLWLPNLSLNIKIDTVKVGRFKPMVNYKFSNFFLYLQPDVKFGTDSLPPNKVFKNLFSADYERVYARYDKDNFGIFIGRERFSIGPSPRYNMLLSGYGPPLDWFHYRLTAKNIQLTYFLSRLDDMYCKPVEYIGDTITTLINARRYLIIKRLEFTPVNWFTCSFSEAATQGGENYALMPYHFNPLVFIHTLQHNWNKDADLFFHLDAKIFLKNSTLYSALLIDDYQLEPDPNGEPNHYGVNFGAEFADFLVSNNFLIIEYHLLSRWIYCIYAPYQRYMYYGYPIGFPYGPDCDELYAKYIHHFNENFDIFFTGSYSRKGENNVNSIWPIPENPRVPGTFFPEDNYLSGVTQNAVCLTTGIRLFYRNLLFFESSLGYLNINNYNHTRYAKKNSILLRIQVGFLHL